MKNLLKIFTLLFTTVIIAQSGHIMQGVGAVNMSMGGASTAQPLDISGALHWNPASISTFNSKIMNFDLGLFFSSPELTSSLPAGMMGPGSPAVSGITEDERGVSPMPSFAMVWGSEDSKSTFGLSFFGISGFGVTFPENMANPISAPQNYGGFGHIESDYMLLQIGGTWAYEFAENFSFGIEPTINVATLEMTPNPLGIPSMTLGYPESDKALAVGFGAQFGLFYDSPSGLKLGASYKTNQSFDAFKFHNAYLDGSVAPEADFQMDYPAITSLGIGYSHESFDIAVDYRMVDYDNTKGFAKKGWTQFGTVQGFGWEDMDIVSVGLQLKVINKLPLRFGYTYSSNPINNELAFYSIPATAIIENAFQFGFSYPFSDNFMFNGLYHHGASGDKTEGQMMNPMMASPSNPYGAIPGTTVGYEMTTDMIMFGFSYTFKK